MGCLRFEQISCVDIVLRTKKCRQIYCIPWIKRNFLLFISMPIIFARLFEQIKPQILYFWFIFGLFTSESIRDMTCCEKHLLIFVKHKFELFVQASVRFFLDAFNNCSSHSVQSVSIGSCAATRIVFMLEVYIYIQQRYAYRVI